MEKMKLTMEEIKDTEGKEYILRDTDRITIGRFTLLERNLGQKNMMIRLRFYKKDRILLREALRIMTRSFLKDGSIYKVNVLVADEVSTLPFTELGYTLEGILVGNRYENSLISNEYIFGTDQTRFNQLKEFKLLALDGERVHLSLASPEKAQDYLQY